MVAVHVEDDGVRAAAGAGRGDRRLTICGSCKYLMHTSDYVAAHYELSIATTLVPPSRIVMRELTCHLQIFSCGCLCRKLCLFDAIVSGAALVVRKKWVAVFLLCSLVDFEQTMGALARSDTTVDL